MSPHEHTAARGCATTGGLEFTRGASELRIYAEQHPGRLLTARFPGRQPAVSVTRETVTSATRTVHCTPGAVALNATVTWAIQVHGGARNIDADLTDVPIASLGIGGGASEVTLRLSEPNGREPIRIGGEPATSPSCARRTSEPGCG